MRWNPRCSRSAAWWAVYRRQIRSELPGRAVTARVMLLQEHEERGTEAALGETAGAAMTGRATIRKQPRGRFALIEILSVCCSPGEHINGAEHEQTPLQFWLRHEFR
jgi:hypothetical protein